MGNHEWCARCRQDDFHDTCALWALEKLVPTLRKEVNHLKGQLKLRERKATTTIREVFPSVQEDIDRTARALKEAEDHLASVIEEIRKRRHGVVKCVE